MDGTLTEGKLSSAAEQTANHLFDTEYLKTDLKGRSVRGGVVTMAAQGARFFLQVGSTVVLARLLTPQDFGLIVMVTAVTGFVAMFKDMGLSMATIQKAQINHGQISTLFWINTAIGFVLALLTIALAPVLAWFYGEPRLTGITVALAGAFIFSGLTIQHQALLGRHMRFFALGLITIIAMAIGVAAAIVAGFYGAGYWALVIMHVVIAAAIAVGVWTAFPWRPGLPKKSAGVREMLSFGGHITGFNIVNYFARNVDHVLLGKFWDAGLVGFYSKAYSLLMLPIRQIRNPLQAVAMPGLSCLQNQRARLGEYYLRLVSLLAFVTMPLTVFLFVHSQDLIKLILGEQWLPAASIFQILAIAAFIQPVLGTVGMLLLSLGQSRRYFKWGCFYSLTVVTSFVVGLPGGAKGIAASYAIANYLILLPSLWYCFRFTPVGVKSFLEAIWRPVVTSIVMGVFVAVFRAHVIHLSAVTTLLVSFALASLGYLLCWLAVPAGKESLSEYWSYIRELFNKLNVQGSHS